MKFSLAAVATLAVVSAQLVAGADSKRKLRSHQQNERETWGANIANIKLTAPRSNPVPTPKPTPKPQQACNLAGAPPITGTAMLKNEIWEIQGDELTSPFVGQRVYNVDGIVTAVNGERFFMQDSVGDGNDHTSDGIEVYLGAGAVAADFVAVGDYIGIPSARVEEYIEEPENTNFNPFQNLGQPTTRLVDVKIDVFSQGNALPDPIVIGVGGRSDSSSYGDYSNGRLPPTESMEEAVKFFESLEGMYVKMESPIAVAPSGVHPGNKDSIYVVSDDGQYATGFSKRGTLNVGPHDFSPEAIQIMEDDEIFGLYFPETSVGTKFDDIEGVISYSGGKYEIVPAEHFGILTPSSLEKEPVSCPKKPFVMSTATYDIHFSKDYGELAAEIVNYLGFPDVLALQHVPLDFDYTLFLQAIETVVAAASNKYVLIPSAFGVPIFYNPWRVSQYDTAVSAGEAPIHLAAKLKFLPLQEKFVMINVQLTDKSESAAVQGVNQPYEDLIEANDINGGVEKRLVETTTVRNLIASPFVADKGKVIVLGKMYDPEFVTPIENLEGVPLKNLVKDLPYDERYSTIVQGASQAWDYIFVGDFFCPGASADYARINSEFYGETPYDPMLACIEIDYDDSSNN